MRTLLLWNPSQNCVCLLLVVTHYVNCNENRMHTHVHTLMHIRMHTHMRIRMLSTPAPVST